jgi:alpha-tubulin suppressor-like RCC1 family protein
MRSPFALTLAVAVALSAAACIVEQDLGSHGARDGTSESSGTGVGGGIGVGGGASVASSAVSGASSSSGSSAGSGATVCDGGVCREGQALAVGEYHTCVIVVGGVKCWGYDGWGLLGDGSKPGSVADVYQPVDAKGLSGVTAVSAGGDHTCALTTGGGVKCWGHNIYGYLGNGSLLEARVPGDVMGLASGAAAVSAAGRWTCALTVVGGVRCWGSNGSNALVIDDDSTINAVPVDRAGLSSGVVAVAAGGRHGCAVLSTGGIVCWGNNDNGQLGDGTWTKRVTPTAVTGLSSGVSAVAAGAAHTCALTTGGGVTCWGQNTKGQLGNGTTMDSSVPVDVMGLSAGVASISAGKAQTCVVTTGGGVKCWGENGNGKLGSGILGDSSVPVDVVGLSSGAVAVATNVEHTCALLASGGVMCWGDNYHYQLGNNTLAGSTVPVAVMGL